MNSDISRSCASLPLVNSAGTSITCTTASDRDARIAAVRFFAVILRSTYLTFMSQTGASGGGSSNQGSQSNSGSNTGNSSNNGTSTGNNTGNGNNNGNNNGSGNNDDDPQKSLSQFT